MKLLYPLAVLLFAWPCSAQIVFADKDIDNTIAFYKTITIANLRDKMPPSVTDAAYKKSAHAILPFKELQDRKLTAALKLVLRPLLLLYDRLEAYEIVIVDNPIPFAMLDSGVLLIISIEMIKRAENDDELLGYVAHEIGHEYFALYSNYSKYLLELVSQRDNEPVFRNFVVGALALIELQCDAFAALTLSSLDYSPLEFVSSMERLTSEFPKQVISSHPVIKQRRHVVEGLTKVQLKPRQSKAFLQLKEQSASTQ